MKDTAQEKVIELLVRRKDELKAELLGNQKGSVVRSPEMTGVDLAQLVWLCDLLLEERRPPLIIKHPRHAVFVGAQAAALAFGDTGVPGGGESIVAASTSPPLDSYQGVPFYTPPKKPEADASRCRKSCPARLGTGPCDC